jgi:iron complex transport system substrate-binding protein
MVLALCGLSIERARQDYQLLKSLEGFDALPAAENGRIYLVDGSSYFARPGPRIVDSLEILAATLHPDEFPEFTNYEKARVD